MGRIDALNHKYYDNYPRHGVVVFEQCLELAGWRIQL